MKSATTRNGANKGSTYRGERVAVLDRSSRNTVILPHVKFTNRVGVDRDPLSRAEQYSWPDGS